jgi:hypothetical protein
MLDGDGYSKNMHAGHIINYRPIGEDFSSIPGLYEI